MDGAEFQRRMNLGRAEQERVFHEYYGWLEQTCLTVCHKYRIYNQTADDIVQEVITTAYVKWETYDGRAALRSWIYQITKNRIIDELRKLATHPIESFPDNGDENVFPLAYLLSGNLEQQICVAQVIAALEGQPEARTGSKKMIDMLTYIVEHAPSTEELATFLKTTETAAKERKSYLYKRLKDLCMELCGDDYCRMIKRCNQP